MKKLTALVTFIFSTKSTLALACAACAGGGFPVQVIKGYVNATVLLAAMPFAVAGILFLVIWRLRSKH